MANCTLISSQSTDYSEDVKTMSSHHIEQISSGCGERVSLYIRWNNARLIIHLDPSPSSCNDTTTIENSFIERYNVAADAEDDDEADNLSDEILDAIVAAGKTVFDKLAPPPAAPQPADQGISTDLHTLLLPDEYTFCFRTLNGKTELVRCDDDGTGDGASLDPFGHPFRLRINDNFNLPRFCTKDIRVLENILHNGYITRVTVDGSGEMCAKAGDSKGPDAAQGELDCLSKITTSQYASSIRVPKLLGLIATPDDERIIGFLEEFIPVSDTWELSTLGNIDLVSEIAPDRRRKWASQVQETVHLLHQIGVVWGDGKASNVLVHRDTDDAWVIDFGGGWTDGWVTPELSGTVEGDELAVKKIFEFLEVFD